MSILLSGTISHHFFCSSKFTTHFLRHQWFVCMYSFFFFYVSQCFFCCCFALFLIIILILLSFLKNHTFIKKTIDMIMIFLFLSLSLSLSICYLSSCLAHQNFHYFLIDLFYCFACPSYVNIYAEVSENSHKNILYTFVSVSHMYNHVQIFLMFFFLRF